MPFDFESPIFAGEAAQVACMLSEGDLPINITWSYNPHPGVTVNRVGSKASMLVIERTAYDHRGTYTCTATNLAGSSNYSSLLYVNGNEVLLATASSWSKPCVLEQLDCTHRYHFTNFKHLPLHDLYQWK